MSEILRVTSTLTHWENDAAGFYRVVRVHFTLGPLVLKRTVMGKASYDEVEWFTMWNYERTWPGRPHEKGRFSLTFPTATLEPYVEEQGYDALSSTVMAVAIRDDLCNRTDEVKTALVDCGAQVLAASLWDRLNHIVGTDRVHCFT